MTSRVCGSAERDVTGRDSLSRSHRGGVGGERASRGARRDGATPARARATGRGHPGGAGHRKRGTALGRREDLPRRVGARARGATLRRARARGCARPPSRTWNVDLDTPRLAGCLAGRQPARAAGGRVAGRHLERHHRRSRSQRVVASRAPSRRGARRRHAAHDPRRSAKRLVLRVDSPRSWRSLYFVLFGMRVRRVSCAPEPATELSLRVQPPLVLRSTGGRIPLPREVHFVAKDSLFKISVVGAR